MFDVTNFSLKDMTVCGAALRDMHLGARSMEETANRIVGYLNEHLTDTADRISVGELDAEIEIKSNDEIGELSEAIVRMQESIRLSIERLRKRR